MQASAPIYKLMVTELGGEKRFASAVARRLQSLGALTRGDRRAASGIDLSESNLDNPLGRKALRYPPHPNLKAHTAGAVPYDRCRASVQASG